MERFRSGGGHRVRLAVLGAGLVTTGLLAACNSGAPTGAAQGTLATVTATSASPGAQGVATLPAPTPPPTAATTPPPTAAATPTSKELDNAAVKANFADARIQWKLGATAISADQGIYWVKAATDLSKTGTAPGFPNAVKALLELTSLPDAQQTPKQNAAYHADINALNKFFKTPGLYS